MPVKHVVLLYTQPRDPAAFEEHHVGLHMALAAKMPGVAPLLGRRHPGTPWLAGRPF